MKRKIKEIVFGETTGDIAVQHSLGKTLEELVINRLSSENIQTEEVDIVLTIDGKEYDHEKFFKHLADNYFKYLKTQAEKLIVEETMDKISDLKDSLDLLNSKVEALRDNIDFDMRIIKRTENEED